MQRTVAFLLCLTVFCGSIGGCASFDVSAFGLPLNGASRSGRTTEETLGSILILGLAIAASVGGYAALVD